MIKSKSITVQGKEISIILHRENDYFSLTDLCRGFEGGSALIEKWLSSKSTIEYLAAWESLNNPDFNSPEFGGIMIKAGSNTFYMSVKKWVNSTRAIGIIAKTGRHGGTYAHKDIALKFCSYLSPTFELYINKEFQRLKEVESNQYNLEWTVKRILSKANYYIQTEAIQKHIIPKSTLAESKLGIEYAIEADLLNSAIFGCTAKEWQVANPSHVLEGKNIRDFASVNELVVLSNLQSLNAAMIKADTPKKRRFNILKTAAKEQLEQFTKLDIVKALRKKTRKPILKHTRKQMKN